MADRLDILEAPDWFLQPGDRVAETVANVVRTWPVFKRIFGDSIVDYKRTDFAARELPALRIYNDRGRNDSDTWYLGGDVTLDLIFPASIRRAQTKRLPALVTAALLALMRSQKFFGEVKANVPGLNELGKSFAYDHSLGFIAADTEEINPLTQVTINFRILLNEWDEFLESDERTRDEPFERTLGDLETILLQILGVNDAGEVVIDNVASTINVKKEQ